MSDVVLAVVDGYGFRRAALVEFLSEWARGHDGRVEGLGTVESLGAAVRCEATMVVLSVGSAFAGEGWEATIRALRGLDEERPVVVLSDTETPRDILLAFRAGARGFLPTSLEPEVVFEALTFILHGGAYVPPSVLAACRSPVGPPSGERLLRHDGGPRIPPPAAGAADEGAHHGAHRTTPDAAPDAALDGTRDGAATPAAGAALRFALTARQGVVLGGLCRGESNKEIARDLDMSEATVKVHVRQVLRKLGASNRTQAALIASGTGGGGPALMELPARAAAAPRPGRYHA